MDEVASSFQVIASLFILYNIRSLDKNISRFSPFSCVGTKKLGQQLMKYLRVLQSTLDGIIVSNRDGLIEFCNQTASTMFGYADKELEGQAVEVLMHEIFRQTHVSQRFGYMTASHPQPRLMNQGKRFIAVRKDGVEFPVSISLNPIDIDGKSYVLASIQDMTQIEAFKIKLEQSQKLEALGEMVAGIAHNFNNVIAGIAGQTYLLSNAESLSAEGDARVESVHSLCNQASDIIKQLLLYARHQKEEFSNFILGDVIEEFTTIAKLTAPKNITVQFNITQFDFQLHGMKSQIQQTLLNIFNNACHAIGDTDGVVSIDVSPCAGSCSKLKQCEFDHDGTAVVCINITDTGKGIAEENIHRIFDPFFTTKPVGQGTGLGLSTSYGIIKKHGGDISVHSKQDEGTTFQIYLPIMEMQSRVEVTTVAVEQKANDSKSYSILIIDDEPSIMQALSDILSQFGHTTFTAANGQQGVDIFSQHQHEVDLILSDLSMPNLNGYEVLTKVREIKPDIPFILISGHQDCAINDTVLNEKTRMMSKPFDYTQLNQLVYKMISC